MPKDASSAAARHPAKRDVELTERELRWTREFAAEGVRLVRSQRIANAPTPVPATGSER
jgi:hypothetical protein